MMLDPRLYREEPGRVRRMLEARRSGFDLDALVRADRLMRDRSSAVDGARRRRNEAGKTIARHKGRGGEAERLLGEMRGMAGRLEEAEKRRSAAEAECMALARTIPNMLHESVPDGPDGASNVIVRSWGEPRPAEGARDHVSIAVGRGLVDLEGAARAAGARFYYLKGGLVRLSQALVSHALDLLEGRGYEPVQPPYLINRRSMEGAVIAEDLEGAIYGVEGEDLYLIGTSEHAVAAMRADSIMDGKKLPARYAGVSPCFRKEAGAHGDQKGIFRVHQFDKVEQFVFSRPEESWAEHERMLGIAEEFYRSLGIPYRVALLSSGDTGSVAAKTYDIEAWMPGQGAYREVVSCSNCLDFQSRRLMVRFRDSTDAATSYAHTLNSTVVATTRAMVAIMENFQEDDGRVRVPDALRDRAGADYV